MSEQKRSRTHQARTKAKELAKPSAKELVRPSAPSVPPTTSPANAAAQTAGPTVAPRAVQRQGDEAPHDPQGKSVFPLDAFTGTAIRALRAQLTCTTELSAEWYKLLLVASWSTSQAWLALRTRNLRSEACHSEPGTTI